MSSLECLSQRSCEINGKQTTKGYRFEDKTLLYKQPPKQQLALVPKPYKRPTLSMEIDTSYSTSYLKQEPFPATQKSMEQAHRILAESTGGKYDFVTVNQTAYMDPDGRPAKLSRPKTSLGCRGCYMDMGTTHKTSYITLPYKRTEIIRPCRGKLQQPVAMETRTTVADSYLAPDRYSPLVKIKPHPPRKIEFKIDYATTNQLSYPFFTVKPRKVVRKSYLGPKIKMEKETTYNTSYPTPGCFVKRTASNF